MKGLHRGVSLVGHIVLLPPDEFVRRSRLMAAKLTHALRQRARALVGRQGAPLPATLCQRALYGPGAVLPVEWPGTPEVAMPLDRLLEATREVLAHRFDLLGSGPIRVGFSLDPQGLGGHRYPASSGAEAGEARRQAMGKLLNEAVQDYDPIDWHVDYKTGFRWNPGTWFSSVRYGQRPGVDVKVPWELSRMQHIAVLGLTHRLAPDSREGAAAAREFRLQIVDWVAANPVRRGVNWALPMDTALRAVSWLAGLALFHGECKEDAVFRSLVCRSLVQHGRFIEDNLEYDPERNGNHYLSNLLGLVAIGAALPGLPEADRWIVYGLQELESEIRLQVLPDGVDVEGSTAYHGFVGDMFAVAAAIATRIPAARRRRLKEVPPGPVACPVAPKLRPWEEQHFDLEAPGIFSPTFRQRLRGLASFITQITKANGLIPQFGDNDSGRVLQLGPAPDPRDWRSLPALVGRMVADPSLEAAGEPYGYSAELVAPERGVLAKESSESNESTIVSERGPAGECVWFPAGGVAIARTGDLFLAIHGGLLTPRSPASHFHNDLLSFELQWRRADIVVDPGTFVYTPLPEARDAYRATSAHNTVAVEGREQRLWPPREMGLFMISEDAESLSFEEIRDDGVQASCRYASVFHRRTWRWAPNRLEVQDHVETDRPARSILNLAPGVAPLDEPESVNGSWLLRLRTPAGPVALRWEGVQNPIWGPGLYSIGYGKAVACVRLQAALLGPESRFVLELSP